ncbi:hypothetical protein N7450_005424 [Penicillium hetheringtonii]|uniref:C2H2-type domain-containing protein n=1 Tax=Penicillium hetheringtonii TaxID=911720 RepID=A0AAD6GSB7_9EURO|nr:hypothetical protein N7450_005424 [Penicillium hetheringtonii]
MLCNPAPSSPNSPVTRKARRRRKTSKEERICPICAHFFKKAEHLARHMRAHSKEKPFGCPVCHKNFARHDHYQAAQTTSATAGRESADRAELTSGDPIPHQGPNDSYGLEVDPVAVAPTVSPSLPNSTAIEMPAPTLSIENKNTQLQPLVSTDPELMLSVGPSGYWRGQSSPAHIFPSFRTEREWETLLTGDAFDLDAANLSLLHATADLAPGSNTMSGLDTQSNFQPSVPGDLERENGKLSAMQKKWHTYCERPSSGYITPDIPCGGSIDETLRDRLAQRLEQRMQYGILPSTPFLVSFSLSD